jgi:hypothetical protein
MDLRKLIAKLADANDMRGVFELSQVARRSGAVIVRRWKFSVQPTSKAGQIWVQLLQ